MEMNDFTMWLYGYLHDKNRDLTEEETNLIKTKLDSCFNKITPNTFPYYDDTNWPNDIEVNWLENLIIPASC